MEKYIYWGVIGFVIYIGLLILFVGYSKGKKERYKNKYLSENKERLISESQRCPSCGGRKFIVKIRTYKEYDYYIGRYRAYSNSNEKIFEDLVCANCRRILMLKDQGFVIFEKEFRNVSTERTDDDYSEYGVRTGYKTFTDSIEFKIPTERKIQKMLASKLEEYSSNSK